jgi:hypothetical protein
MDIDHTDKLNSYSELIDQNGCARLQRFPAQATERKTSEA